MNRPGRILMLAAVVICSGIPGAGCVELHKGGLFPADRDRVFVDFFYNETFYRDVEFQLGDQIVDEILSRPGLRLSSKDDAEVILTGRILKVEQHVLSENPQLNPTSENTTITVEVRVEDAHTGKVLKQAKVSGRGEFVQALGQTIQTGRETAYKFLARDIVRVLEEEF